MKAFWNTVGVLVGIPVGVFLAIVVWLILLDLLE